MPQKREKQTAVRQPPSPKTNTSNQNSPTKPTKQKSPPKEPLAPVPAPENSVQGKKPEYKYIGKLTITQILKKHLPHQLIPTARFAKILEIIFIAVIILGILQFPLGKLLAGGTEITTEIGYPWIFLQLNIQSAENPLLLLNLLLDFIIYLLLAYIIDISINIILSARIIKSEKELKKIPEVFKLEKPNLAKKTTQKVFKKQQNTPKPPTPKIPTPKPLPQPAP
jgi:hypothetical protein